MLMGNHNYVTLLSADEILITDSANLIGTIILRCWHGRGKKARKQVDKNFSLRNRVGCMIGIGGVKSKETRHIMDWYQNTTRRSYI